MMSAAVVDVSSGAPEDNVEDIEFEEMFPRDVLEAFSHDEEARKREGVNIDDKNERNFVSRSELEKEMQLAKASEYTI
jgi:hypothetical protein